MTPEEIKELFPCMDYWCAVLPCVCVNNINEAIAAEREACAKVADGFRYDESYDFTDRAKHYNSTSKAIAAAIRARKS